MTKLPLIEILLLLCVAVHPACDKAEASELPETFALTDTMLNRIELVEVSMEPVETELRLFGKITAENDKKAHVYPVVGGIVTSVRVELGDYVKQGQVLATIRSGEIAQYQKERQDALNALSLAEKNLQVARDLQRSRLNSEREVAAAEKEVENARAELSRISDIFSIYRLQDGSVFQVTAPISGFVIEKQVTQNEQISADLGASLFSIADINEVWAMANVSESDIAKVKVGQAATIQTLAFPDRSYQGAIDKIFNAIDPETRAMKARITLPNADLMLKPEMNCTVNLRFASGASLPTIPASALIFEKSRYWVMVFHSREQIETRPVTVHSQLGDKVFIAEGLAAGESIIATQSLFIYDALND